MTFPNHFHWGVATSAYQIEGAPHHAGGGRSVWDMYVRRPGSIAQGETADVACDHYERSAEDVALMAELGIQAYRFSISWPRVIPAGTGAVNQRGLDFYDQLVDRLLEAGITPYATLFHWDFPYELYCRGGWLNRESADWFAEYTRVVVERLSDRVQHWMTHNEQQCFIGLGHRDGVQAPGMQWDWPEVLRAGHHALLAHGKAIQAIRAYARRPCLAGVAPVGITFIPASDSPADVEAARQSMFTMRAAHYWNNTWWMDPIFSGRYPEDGLALFGAAAPDVLPDDMETISQPLDFLGLNIYHGRPVRAGADGEPEQVPLHQGFPRTAMSWQVTPEALYWGPRLFWERYRTPLLITENGLACNDWVSLDGAVHDPQRIDFLQRYLLQLERACEDGVDVRAYFQWSFMDNFEWSEGYRPRFGLVYVDYPTQRRIPKDSALWYRDLIRSRGGILGDRAEETGHSIRDQGSGFRVQELLTPGF